MTPEQARAAIIAGTAPNGLHVDGALSFYTSWGKEPRLTRLPDDLYVKSLYLSNQGDLRALPKGLRCDDLTIADSLFVYLPADLQVRDSLSLVNCPYLATLPYNFTVRSLRLDRCGALRRLP